MNRIIDTFNLTNAEGGLLMSIVVVPGVFLSLPAGVLAERHGARNIGFVSAIFIAAGSVVGAAADSFVLFLVGRLVLGIGGVLMITTTPFVISQWFPQEELGKAMGIYGINMPLSVVAAFSLSSYLSISYDWRYSLYISAILALLNVFIFLLIVKEASSRNEHRPYANPRPALTNIEIWKVGLVWLFFNAAMISFTTWSPKIFQDWLGMDPVYASFLALLAMGIQIFFGPIFGWVSDRTGRRKPFIFFASVLFTGLLVSMAFTSYPLLVLLILGLGITGSFFSPILNSLPPSILAPGSISTGFGIISICGAIGVVFAAPLIGLVLDVSGSSTLSYFAMAVFAGFAILASFVLKNK